MLAQRAKGAPRKNWPCSERGPAPAADDHVAARSWRGRPGRWGRTGMTTAEYAVGTVAACGFAGVLFKLLTSDSVVRMLKDIVERALTIAF